MKRRMKRFLQVVTAVSSFARGEDSKKLKRMKSELVDLAFVNQFGNLVEEYKEIYLNNLFNESKAVVRRVYLKINKTGQKVLEKRLREIMK